MTMYWLTQTAADVPGGGEWLTAAERQKLEELRYTKRRTDWRLGRWTAKRAVCAFLKLAGEELDPSEVEITAAEGGAPVLRVTGATPALGVSISHSAGLGLCAVGKEGCAFGCDAEVIARRSERFIEDYFTSHEYESVRCAPGEERDVLSTLIWSAKESTMKALGEGLRRDTRSIATSFVPGAGEGDWSRFEAECTVSGKRFSGWWRRFDDHILTIAFGGLDAPPPVRLGCS